VLTLPKRLKFHGPDELLQKLRPGTDGVILRLGSRQGLFLPQVWEQIPDKQEFLSRLAEDKAGLAPSAWKQSDAKILVFQVEAFQEPKGGKR
jgi:AMMECR1 domain-containing protein